MNKIKEVLLKSKCDAILIINIEPVKDTSFFAFSGIEHGSFTYSSLLLYKKKSIILTSALEELEAKKTGLKYIVVRKLKEIKKYFPKIKKIGINYGLVPIAISKKIPFKKVDVSKIISEVLEKKSHNEYLKFKKSCNIVDKIAEKIPGWVNKKTTEKMLAEKIDYGIRKNSAEPAFNTIVAFGKNSAIPHHLPSNKIIKENEIILVDFGAKYKNICSDMTRCYFFGTPSKIMVETYNKVKEIQIKSIKKLKIGANGKDIYEFAKTEIEKNTKGIMNHSLGHGIGYDVHEASTLSSTNHELKENSFTTVEPGCYIENKFGIRIEDCIVVRKNKPEVLTTATKELIIIPYQ